MVRAPGREKSHPAFPAVSVEKTTAKSIQRQGGRVLDTPSDIVRIETLLEFEKLIDSSQTPVIHKEVPLSHLLVQVSS